MQSVRRFFLQSSLGVSGILWNAGSLPVWLFYLPKLFQSQDNQNIHLPEVLPVYRRFHILQESRSMDGFRLLLQVYHMVFQPEITVCLRDEDSLQAQAQAHVCRKWSADVRVQLLYEKQRDVYKRQVVEGPWHTHAQLHIIRTIHYVWETIIMWSWAWRCV